MTVHKISDRACFYPRDEDGHPVEYGDGIPHFSTAAQCESFMHDTLVRDLDIDSMRAVPEGAPCWTFECDECGVDAHELSDGYGAHFPSRHDAMQAVRDYDGAIMWRRVLCEECRHAAEREQDE